MFGARPSGKVTKNKVLDNQIMGMKTTVSDHGLFQRAWVGGWLFTQQMDALGHVISQIFEMSCDFVTVELTKIPSPCFLNSYLVACTVHYL